MSTIPIEHLTMIWRAWHGGIVPPDPIPVFRIPDGARTITLLDGQTVELDMSTIVAVGDRQYYHLANYRGVLFVSLEVED